ncbi:proline dehydrogenase family protein [Micropruina sonneratiae]|uniref:proline dehydrogenase family protein n=1 Tax=Micropruina sonneratiae TaxID=2986940 RepID=UPI002226366E|nr:proline dehydrogenase family protein [Micropruina sp. KQZ13P-5]MCW3158722.1 proline dehydrogenase family protein [Micropruina sp. KQZ13P-5]
MLKSLLLGMSRTPAVKKAVVAFPLTRRVVQRFVAGETVEDCLRTTRGLLANGLLGTIDFLGEDTTTAAQADRVTDTYVELLRRLSDEGIAGRVEVSIKLSALGSQLKGGYELALDNARVICAAAERAGTTVTVDMEDHTSTDATLRTVTALREQYPWVGAVLQSMLYRTSTDCQRQTGPGDRVRLCKGAYAEPADVAHKAKPAVDRNYKRCATILLEGEGRPMFATHHDEMISHAISEAQRNDRADDSFELQMLLGIRSDEQRRLAAKGYSVRVYVPFGTDWYAYFMRRLAERPANVVFLIRALFERPARERAASGF